MLFSDIIVVCAFAKFLNPKDNFLNQELLLEARHFIMLAARSSSQELAFMLAFMHIPRKFLTWNKSLSQYETWEMVLLQ